MKLTAANLSEACADDAFASGIAIHAILEPMGGPGAPVKPAVYAGGLYQVDTRWYGEGDDREPVQALVIDNVPSQANRAEAALEKMAAKLGLPQLQLDLSEHPHLPAHIPPMLSSFRFPHRNADAYIRDASFDGVDFPKTEIGRSLLLATPWEPDALVEWIPQALLYGFWQSHLGNKGPQTKLARSWTSEIVGYKPGSVDTHRLGLKGDPLNLSIDEAVEYDADDVLDWSVLEAGKKAGSKTKDRLSNIGHGQVPVSGKDAPLGGVSFLAVEQHAVVSFASLRNITTDTSEKNSVLRAMLVALGIVGHVGAFGRGFTLRSGADLRPMTTSWTWLGESSDVEIEVPTLADAQTLFSECVSAAQSVGLPVGSAWADEPLRITPNKSLADVIAKTFPEYSL